MAALNETRVNTVGKQLNQELLAYDMFDYLKPPVGFDEEKNLNEIASGLGKYDRGLIVGRFQPLHYGHLFLIKLAARICDKVVIGIGSANVVNKENPFTADQREEWIKRQLSRYEELDGRIEFVRLNDVGNGKLWAENTLQAVGKIDVVVGNNHYVNKIFSEEGIDIAPTPPILRDVCEGTQLRRKMRERNRID